MNLDLSKLFDSMDQDYQFEGSIEKHDLNERLVDANIFEPIKYSGRIYEELDGYYIELDIDYILETNCARCMIDVKRDLKASIYGKLEEYEDFYEEVEEDGEIIREIIEEPVYLKNGILKLDDYVLMEIASSIPMKILCKEDCKGLCKKCGTDLNKGTCSCDTDFIDPRLAKLKDFVIED